ncbi:MAG: ABC transporter C-terminal domain-containing protein, partial [Pseudonocardiaceae bacterium]
GGIEEYLQRWDAAFAVATPPVASTGPPTAAAVTRATRKELARLERQLERLAERESALQHQLAEQAVDPGAFRELDGELRAVLTEKDDLETRWLEVADAVDS